jgi:hypothetical protein
LAFITGDHGAFAVRAEANSRRIPMGTMLERVYGSAIPALLFVVVVLWGEPAGAQTTTGEPAPRGMTACDFVAESGDASEQGLAVRVAPDAAAEVLGYIPTTGDKQEGSVGETKQGQGFRVLDAKDGWFQIEGANYVNLQNPSSVGEKGWVDGRSVTVRLYRETLKAAPNDAAPDIVYLVAYDADGVSLYSPHNVPVSRWRDGQLGSISPSLEKRQSRQRLITIRQCFEPSACRRRPKNEPMVGQLN